MKLFKFLAILSLYLVAFGTKSQTINLNQSITDGAIRDVIDPDSLDEIAKDVQTPEETESDKIIKISEETKKKYKEKAIEEKKSKTPRKSYMEIRKEKEMQRKAEMEEQMKAEREARESYRNNVQDLNDISKTFRGDNYRVSY